jgi:hypothetical protein
MLLGALALVILILLPFIRPLAFGVLFGAVLFPAKRRLASSITSWIENLEKDETPALVAIVKLPFSALERLGELIIFFIMTHIKIILFGSGFLITLRVLLYILPKQFFTQLVSLIQWQHSLFENVIGSFSSTIVIGVCISYVITVYLLWNSRNANLFTISGQLIWIFIIAYGCSYFGPFQIPAFAACMIYGFLGLVYHDSSYNQYLKRVKEIFVKEKDAVTKAEVIQEEKHEGAEASTPLTSKDILNATKSCRRVRRTR